MPEFNFWKNCTYTAFWLIRNPCLVGELRCCGPSIFVVEFGGRMLGRGGIYNNFLQQEVRGKSSLFFIFLIYWPRGSKLRLPHHANKTFLMSIHFASRSFNLNQTTCYICTLLLFPNFRHFSPALYMAFLTGSIKSQTTRYQSTPPTKYGFLLVC